MHDVVDPDGPIDCAVGTQRSGLLTTPPNFWSSVTNWPIKIAIFVFLFFFFFDIL